MKTVLVSEMQNIHHIRIRKALSEWDLSDDVQSAIIEFCPRYTLNMMERREFKEVWKSFSDSKISKEENKNYELKTTGDRPLNMMNKYEILITDPTVKGSIFFNVFGAMKNEIDWIFNKEDIEILDYRMSIQYGFWDDEYSEFVRLLEETGYSL